MTIMSTSKAIPTSLLHWKLRRKALPDHLYGFSLLVGWKIAKPWALANQLHNCSLEAIALRMCVLRNLLLCFWIYLPYFYVLRVLGVSLAFHLCAKIPRLTHKNLHMDDYALGLSRYVFH